MQRRIGHRETAVAHRPSDMDYRMARHTTQSRLRLWRIDLLLDRAVELTVEENGVIVAASAPLARLRSLHILHILDRLPIELIVERCEVMNGALPLIVNVFVALTALLRLHKEPGGNEFP